MHVTARADYAVRAVIELASRHSRLDDPAADRRVAGDPGKFLETILGDLRRAGCSKPSEGPRAATGSPPTRRRSGSRTSSAQRKDHSPRYAASPRGHGVPGPAAPLTDVWVAVRASLRDVLEATTVADVLADRLPGHVRALLERPDSRVRR